jgi:hypothetical protein
MLLLGSEFYIPHQSKSMYVVQSHTTHDSQVAILKHRFVLFSIRHPEISSPTAVAKILKSSQPVYGYFSSPAQLKLWIL